MNPEVSYIVVCFNSEKFISKCITSILNQSHKNYEIIIIDNNSQDSTVSIAKDFSVKNKQIKLITNASNIGYGNAVTIAAEHAQGEFLAILNADVFLDREWTNNLLKTFRTNEKIMSASGRIFFPNGELQSSGGIMDKYGAVVQRESKAFHARKIKNGDYFFYNDGSSLMIRRKIFDEISFDPNLFLYYEDVDLSWKIRMLGYKIEHVADAISYHALGHSVSYMTPSKFYYIARNRIYVCLKNYSLKNTIYRIPFALFLISLNALFYDLPRGSKGYTLNMLKAIFWNIINLKIIMKERKKMRFINKIPDSVLDRYLLPHSIDLTLESFRRYQQTRLTKLQN